MQGNNPMMVPPPHRQGRKEPQQASLSGVPFPNAPNIGEFYQPAYNQGNPGATNGMMGSDSMMMPPRPQPQQHAQQAPSQQQQYYMPGPMPPPQSGTSFEDEPPLLEELGINIGSVINKVKLVANPLSKIDNSFADDADMTGPVILYLLLGFLLLLQRKIQFGVIYGQATVGCLAVYVVFNLMAARSSIDLYRVTSILGYALLPMVVLSFFAVFVPVKTYRIFGTVLGGSCIFWSTTTATKIFVAVLTMHDQFWLVWYPLALVYTSFAFITVF